MEKQNLPKQPSLFISYLEVSKWLLVSQGLFIAESLFYWHQLQKVQLQNSPLFIAFWWSCFLFAFVHIFLVFMDSWSRFQNYKRVKDQLFEYGFRPKIANNYISSKCQRHALKVAAKELGLLPEANQYLNRIGIRWHHFIPKFVVKDPFFIFKKHFWNRTFLEKYYTPKFSYRKLYTSKLSV